MVHAGLPGVGVPAVPGGGGELCEGPPAGWLVVVDGLSARGSHQVGRLGLAAPTEAAGTALVESVDVEPGDIHGLHHQHTMLGQKSKGAKRSRKCCHYKRGV